MIRFQDYSWSLRYRVSRQEDSVDTERCPEPRCLMYAPGKLTVGTLQPEHIPEEKEKHRPKPELLGFQPLVNTGVFREPKQHSFLG